MTKQKIAILGGGVGGITTAFELTNDPNWKDKYESITVYQLGWRLGGKAASGRNADNSNRIQEHGLHVFMGFYQNAFSMMRRAYDECRAKGLTPASPFQTVEDAFSKVATIVVTDRVGREYDLWPQLWPETNEFPGTKPSEAGGVKPFILEIVLRAADLVFELLPLPGPLRNLLLNTARLLAGNGLVRFIADLVVRISTALSNFLPAMANATHEALRVLGAGSADTAAGFESQLINSRQKAKNLFERGKSGENILDEDLRQVVTDVDSVCRLLLRALKVRSSNLDPEARKIIIAADLLLTAARGVLADGLLDGDFEKIDDLDLADWFRRHGSLFQGNDVLTRALYDATFAYEDGNRQVPKLSAASGLYGALRLFLTYSGAIMWRFNAGMGDTIFTPLYLALRSRGVQFEFFQKVTNLGLSQDKSRIEKIEIDVQAELKPERGGIYEPLKPVQTMIGGVERTLLCWPDRPNYDQLIQGDALQSSNLVNPDLESYWTDWKPTPEIKRTLILGKDFDSVVLGISLGALPLVASELVTPPSSEPNVGALQQWRAMVDNLKTVRTQGFQLWFHRTFQEMGFRLPPKFTGRPILISFVEPFDTWSDQTHLVPAENYNPLPKQIAYLCNAAPNDPAEAPFSDPTYPQKQKEKALLTANRFLDSSAKTIWPNAFDHSQPPQFDRRLIQDEFLRLNIDPTERYVLSIPGSRRFRIKPFASGFVNLFPAGDWTRSILDVGCAEAAVISGKLAAQGISGIRAEILGLIGAKWEEIEAPIGKASSAGVGG